MSAKLGSAVLRSRWALGGLLIALVALVGLGDRLTGPEFAFGIFYALPVALGAWFLGRRAAAALSLMSVATWLMADDLGRLPSPHPFLLYWEAVAHLGFLVIVALSIAALRSRRDMERQLVDFIVHDLRTPASAVGIALSSLLREPERLDCRQRQVAEIAKSASGRMLELIESLLNLSRLEAHRMPVEPQVLSLGDVVARVTQQELALWAEDHEITIQAEVPASLPRAYADPAIVERVLANLLGNAVKHSPPGSQVRVRAERNGAEVLTISVADQGPGIPREWARRVFNRFEQVRARSARVPVGTGLGLAFCRLAVEAIGGHIWLESEPGAGTTVSFTVPAANGTAVPSP